LSFLTFVALPWPFPCGLDLCLAKIPEVIKL